MTDIWYYADGENPIGPLSMPDIVAVLSRVSDPARVAVWRNDFSSWREVASVPELAAYVIKPPPLPARAARPIPPPTPEATMKTAAQQTWPRAPAGLTRPLASGKELVGIGGWLVFVALAQLSGPIRMATSLANYYSSLDNDAWTNFPIVFYGEAIMNASVMTIMIVTTYLFFAKSYLFPSFFILEYAASILLYPLDIAWGATGLSAYTGQSIGQFVDKMIEPKDAGQWIVVIISAAIWIPYVLRSKRVANTFIRHRQP